MKPLPFILLKIAFSGIAVTNARGSIGRDVSSRNHYGDYLREKGTLIYPNTPAQQNLTTFYTTIVQLWQMLDPEIQQDWIQAARKVSRSNSLGNQYNMSGFNYFMSQTFNIGIAGGSPSLLPVAPGLILSPERSLISLLDTTQMFFSFVYVDGTTIVPAETNTSLFATDSISAGITTKHTGFQFIKEYLPGDLTTSQDIIADYLSVYPAPVIGKRIFLRLRSYHQVTGQSSQYCYCFKNVS